MSIRKRAFKGGALLTLGEGLTYAFSFIRNMILARLLTKADFGVVATLVLVITLMEFSAKMGLARFVIRDKDGNLPEFLYTAHFVQFAAAALSSILIFAAAPFIAELFGLAGQANSFRILAALPLLQGITHLDTRRFERDLRFGPSMMVELIPQAVITLLAWPVAVWLKDYRTVLVLLLVKGSLTAAGTFYFAEQRYRWRFNSGFAHRMIRFGWPLILNGLVTFVAIRGDQFIVATYYSMNDLGAYAAAAALSAAPVLFFNRVFASVMLPLMSQVQEQSDKFVQRFGLVVSMVAGFSALYATTLIIGGEFFMQLAFGRKYAGSGVIFGCLVAANAFRLLRLSTAIAAIAKGDSMNEMLANICGGVALVLAITFALSGMPLWVVATSGIVGEAFACSVSFLRLKHRDQVPIRKCLGPAFLIITVVSFAVLASVILRDAGAFAAVRILTAVVGGLVCGGATILILSDSRREVVRSLWRLRMNRFNGVPTPA